MIATYVVLAAGAGLLLYAVLIYNGLVTLRNGVAKAWSNIDVLLKQRHDEIPKLVEVCKAYMQFERETLEKVMLARAGSQAAQARGDIAGVAAAEGPLRGGIGRIAATVEAYPELKANQSMMQLLARITALENEISDRREFYNEYANNNNVRIAEFPDVIIARMAGFQATPLLHFSAEEIADVDVRALFRNAS
jgi:LemA protein